MPKLDHSEFSCVGTSTCLRQRMIPKLFVDSLAAQKAGNVTLQPFSTVPDTGKPTELDQFTKSHAKRDEKTCSDFASIIEQISAKKYEVTKDKYNPLSRPASTQEQKTLYRSSAFVGRKSQGGSFYPVSAKSDHSNLHSQMLIHLKQRQSASKMSTPERYHSIKLQSEVADVLPNVFTQT